MSSGLEQVRECRHHIDLAAIFGEAAQPGLLEAEMLLAAHQPSPGLRSQGYCTANGLSFPESP